MKLGFVGRFLDTFFSLPVLLALLTMLGMQYFFFGNAKRDIVKPVLNREIQFVDHKVRHDREIVSLETSLCEYSFSTLGAVLIDASFKNYKGQDHTPLRTVHERGQFERDQGMFLLAFEHGTPLEYMVENQQKTPGGSEVTFAAETPGKDWKIRKTFRVYDDSYRVDVVMGFTPLKASVEPLTPRLFVPGPFMSELEADVAEGVVQPNGDGSVERLGGSADVTDRSWNAPAVVGVEDKYFLHALVGHEAGFLRQVFYKRTTSGASSLSDASSKRAATSSGLSVILEAAPVTEESQATLNWYVGPKALHAMEAVDERLVSFLSLGWFSFLGRWLLSALETLYSFLGNYGWAIIALTLLIRIPLMPLFVYCKRKAAIYEAVTRRYSVELAGINARFKDDAVARQDAVSALYAEHGSTSAGPAYALAPQLLTIPVLVSLFGLLNNAIALYHAPFFGWMTNLSARDPYYILPVLMAFGIVAQQAFAPVKGRETLILRIVMPMIILAVMVRFPVGVLLYLVVGRMIELVEDVIRATFWRV